MKTVDSEKEERKKENKIKHIHDVREEQRTRCRVDLDIIQRVELPAKEIIQEHRHIMRLHRVDERDGGRERPASRRNENERRPKRARPSVGHLDRVWKHELRGCQLPVTVPINDMSMREKKERISRKLGSEGPIHHAAQWSRRT